MLKLKKKKFLSAALCSMMCLSVFGATLAEAHEGDNPPPPPQQQEHHKHHKQDDSDTHSQGEVTTAAILGAVVGAVIAKTT